MARGELATFLRAGARAAAVGADPGVTGSGVAAAARRLRVNCDVLTVPEDDQQVVFMTADPDTPTARALRDLAPLGGRPSGLVLCFT
jgi:MmyB-like transcription regulator ligand binding domain